ncbi:hypothetical protein BGZ80_007297 [Entomortierella chlamydospora]|uniref:Integral membrane protein n=1 Tax=Entomortierella chlamydospora TaxID=101097 RepID=A0A9P6MZC6_9FUNG|nr:hypothetical protein BGZ79_007096 [Entomortierella chlamydospora]KAG0018337.1 hypothetical protein BGZ80_007297 [Entomortierella chlamydospora]
MAPLRGVLPCVLLALLALLQLTFTEAFKVQIDSDYRKFGCGGMYASSPGKNDSEIRVVMDKESRGNAVVVVFEWNDHGYVGKIDPTNGEPMYICDTIALNAGLCTEAQLGQAIIDTSVDSTVRSASLNFANEETSGIQFFEYQITKTGYYCAMAWPVQVDQGDAYYSGFLEFNNKYGTLAGSDFPKLPFYGTLSLTYMTIGIAWMILCAKHWREILTVQHFISGVIFFLMVEMAFNWGYWDDYNKRGVSSVALLVIVSILNSGRNSLSLFMLLIVSMGYGVVKPTLGSTMKKVIFLSLAHFLFGIIYSAGTMSPVDDVSAMIVLMVVVPLALTMTSFYIWTLQSLTSTIATLNLRRQTEKVKMYTRLWRLLVFSLTVLCAFFVINTLNFMNMDDEDWPATHWRIKWFLLDGWLNILYLIVFTVIVILWRPTENNKRYGIDQLETEDYDENDEHADHNNARAAESMGLTGMKLRPQRRDYEMEDDEVAMFDIGEEDEDDEEDEENDGDDNDLENGGRPSAQRTNSNGLGSSSRGPPGYKAGSSPLAGSFTEEAERERARLEVSKMN